MTVAGWLAVRGKHSGSRPDGWVGGGGHPACQNDRSYPGQGPGNQYARWCGRLRAHPSPALLPQGKRGRVLWGLWKGMQALPVTGSRLKAGMKVVGWAGGEGQAFRLRLDGWVAGDTLPANNIGVIP